LCHVRLKTLGSAIAASYTWISSVCASATAGDKSIALASKTNAAEAIEKQPEIIAKQNHPRIGKFYRPTEMLAS
jgi:hypothetical protein